MTAFARMAEDLSIRIDPEIFRDNGFEPISENEFQQFLKDATFEKLKGEKLGVLFQQKFNVRDRVLSIYSDDQDIISHIRYCKYVR